MEQTGQGVCEGEVTLCGWTDRRVKFVFDFYREGQQELLYQFEVMHVPALGMVENGRFYPYDCNATYEELLRFAEGEFKHYSSRLIRTQKDTSSRVQYVMQANADSFVHILDMLGLLALPYALKLALLAIIMLAPVAVVLMCCIFRPEEEETQEKEEKPKSE